MRTDVENLFQNNREWAARMTTRDPEFFERLTYQQTPQYLWIGCSDSRVPANEIVGLLPGEMFVHRNISNVVVHTDLNCLSVLQYAVDVLHVRHVIVCGHYGCGGVEAAWSQRHVGLSDNWLRHVRDVHQKHSSRFKLLTSAVGVDRLCELNVIEQALHVSQTTILQDAWARGQEVAIHAWIYRLANGLIRDLKFSVSATTEVADRYEAAIR